jgi:hypothetical protein
MAPIDAIRADGSDGRFALILPGKSAEATAQSTSLAGGSVRQRA